MSRILLRNIDTGIPANIDKGNIKKERDQLIEQFGELQRDLYAKQKQSLLIVLQGMDAAGKDGAVRDVFKYINPMYCNTKSYKKPTPEEMGHDFLWRVHPHVPVKGNIAIFNRSHYEDVLIQRVLAWIDEATVLERFNHINAFERLLASNGTKILKFYLHVDQEEQRKRLQERIDIPEKRWKHNEGDWEQRKHWDEYMKAYEDVFHHCSSEIPWHIIPSDKNYYKEYRIVKTIIDCLTE